MDKAFCDHLVDVFLEGPEFSFREVVDRSINRFCIGDKRDFMIDVGSRWRQLFGLAFFKNIGVFSIFERDMRFLGFRGVDRGVVGHSDGGFNFCDIDDSIHDDLISLWIDILGR